MNQFILCSGLYGFIALMDLIIFVLEDDIRAGIWGLVNLIISISFFIIWRIDEFNKDMEPIKYLISGGKNEK